MNPAMTLRSVTECYKGSLNYQSIDGRVSLLGGTCTTPVKRIVFLKEKKVKKPFDPGSESRHASCSKKIIVDFYCIFSIHFFPLNIKYNKLIKFFLLLNETSFLVYQAIDFLLSGV